MNDPWEAKADEAKKEYYDDLTRRMVEEDHPVTISVSEVQAKVETIRAMAGDDEIAHTEEDRLRDEVLRSIAAGAPNSRYLAAAVLKTGDIEFARWCA